MTTERTDRDELAELIGRWLIGGGEDRPGSAILPSGEVSVDGYLDTGELADAIMAAGWMNMHALQDDLDELEATDPIVKRAAERYDEMVREVTQWCRSTHDGCMCELTRGHLGNHRQNLELGGMRWWS